MRPDVLLDEGLLDQQQAEPVEFAQVVDIGDRVRGVRVDLQQAVRPEQFANGRDRLEVPARFDLQFDALVALGDVAGDLVEQLSDRRGDADGDAAVDPVPYRTEVPGEAGSRRAQLRVEQRGLDGGLRHAMADHRGEDARGRFRRGLPGREERR